MKYKLGQKVKVIGGSLDGRVGVIDMIDEDDTQILYQVRFKDGETYWLFEHQLAPLEKNWDNLEVGDTLVNKNGDKTKVLAVLGDVFLRSCWSLDANWETLAGDWFHIQEVQDYGWKIEGAGSTDTIDILGKKYSKDAVIERLKELEEVK